MQRVAVSYGSTPFGTTVVAYVVLHVARYTPDTFRGITPGTRYQYFTA